MLIARCLLTTDTMISTTLIETRDYIMNERMKDTIEQEMTKYYEGEYADSKTAEWSLEEFAESVVKLCASHILTSSDRHRREYFAESLLEHFGVDQ